MVLRCLSSAARLRIRSLSSMTSLSPAMISSASATASVREISSLSSSSRFFAPASAGAPHRIRAVTAYGILLRRSFRRTASQYTSITYPKIESAFKDLVAMSWDEIPDSVINNTKKAISKTAEDKVGQEGLANVFVQLKLQWSLVVF